MDWKEGTLNSEKCTRSLLLLKWLASVRTEESFSETGPKSQRTALRFQKTGFPLVASSSSQNGTKEYNKLVNKMSNTGTEAQLDNEGRENVAKLKSEMKSICQLEQQMGRAGAHARAGSSSVLTAQCGEAGGSKTHVHITVISRVNQTQTTSAYKF